MQIVAIPDSFLTRSSRSVVSTTPVAGQIFRSWQLFAPTSPAQSFDVDAQYTCIRGGNPLPFENLSAFTRAFENRRGPLESNDKHTLASTAAQVAAQAPLLASLRDELLGEESFERASASAQNELLTARQNQLRAIYQDVLARYLFLFGARLCNHSRPYSLKYFITISDDAFETRFEPTLQAVSCSSDEITGDNAFVQWSDLLTSKSAQKSVACNLTTPVRP